MDAESASTVLMNSANENEPKGTAISIAKSLCNFFHTGEKWSQVLWSQQVKSFPCMASSCTGLCGCKTFLYYQVYEKERWSLLMKSSRITVHNKATCHKQCLLCDEKSFQRVQVPALA